MTDIVFDIINEKSVDPNIIFGGLGFRLKKFNFDKDLIFKNMTKIETEDIMEKCLSLISYEFNEINILDKLKELFPSNCVDISDSMFIQLYLYLIKNKKEEKFIFKREAFASFHHASMQTVNQSIIDKKTHMIYMLYNQNYTINELLRDEKCFYDHMNLIKTGIDKNGHTCFTGLTHDGIKSMTVLDWAIYLKSSCKEWFEQTKKINDIEYESDTRDICVVDYDEMKDSIKLYSTKKNLKTLKKYYEVGYFDIWEFSNSKTKLAINTNNNMIVDIKN